MTTTTLSQQLDFITEIDKLKNVARKTRHLNGTTAENDAEHSWHLAMMALILQEHANQPVNILKVLKMVLIHDIVEIDSGDIFLFDTVQNHNNTENELKAAERIFGLLPAPQKEEFIAIWQEFEAAETPEAQFAKAIDRYAPVLINSQNDGGAWREFDISEQLVIEKNQRIQQGSTTLWSIAKKQIQQAFQRVQL